MPVYTLAMLKHPAIMENRSALGKCNIQDIENPNLCIGAYNIDTTPLVPLLCTGTVNANASSCPTQSLLTNNSTSEGNNLSKLAFIPTYGNALSKIAVRAQERAFELRRLLGASVVEVQYMCVHYTMTSLITFLVPYVEIF